MAVFVDNATDGLHTDVMTDSIQMNTKLRWTITVIASANACKMDISSLYALYGVLSDKIHGQSWSGPGILIMSNLLDSADGCFLKSLADSINLRMQPAD